MDATTQQQQMQSQQQQQQRINGHVNGGGGFNISRKNSIIPSAVSLENINAASSLTDAEQMPTSLSPSSPVMYKHQTLQYQSDDSSSYPLSSSTASKHSSALKKKQQRKKTEEVSVEMVKPIQNAVSPLKTGATLLRPTRQASKNAVVIHAFIYMCHLNTLGPTVAVFRRGDIFWKIIEWYPN